MLLDFDQVCFSLCAECAFQAKLPLSFTPSDELAAEGQRLKTAASSPATVPQSQAVRDGLSEEEQKVYALVVRARAVERENKLDCDGDY